MWPIFSMSAAPHFTEHWPWRDPTLTEQTMATRVGNMRCSKCSRDNRAGRKFCTSCGAPLGAACPKCGAPIQPDERFCGECGAAIGASAPRATSSAQPRPLQLSDAITATEVIDGERKTVTALFADIKGSMEL